jgi:hypothetical protein
MQRKIAVLPNGTVSIKTQLKTKIIAMSTINVLYYERIQYIHLFVKLFIQTSFIGMWLILAILSDKDSIVEQVSLVAIFWISNYLFYSKYQTSEKDRVKRFKKLVTDMMEVTNVLDVSNEEANSLTQLNDWIQLVVEETERNLPYNRALLLICLNDLKCQVGFVTGEISDKEDDRVVDMSIISRSYFYVMAFFGILMRHLKLFI